MSRPLRRVRRFRFLARLPSRLIRSLNPRAITAPSGYRISTSAPRAARRLFCWIFSSTTSRKRSTWSATSSTAGSCEKGWYWPQTHNDVVQKVLRKARKGTRVVYVPGNHDSMARQFIGLAFGEIEVADEVIHVTADGKRLLVTHGDMFDGVMQHARWLAYLGDSLYTLTLVLNRWFNWFRLRCGYSYWSLSQYLKHRVKNAVSFITAFERVMAEEARRRECDGVVCGHIHKAEIRTVDGIQYCNDGDWVESLSALAETADGTLEIIHWTHCLDAQAKKLGKPARVILIRSQRSGMCTCFECEPYFRRN